MSEYKGPLPQVLACTGLSDSFTKAQYGDLFSSTFGFDVFLISLVGEVTSNNPWLASL